MVFDIRLNSFCNACLFNLGLGILRLALSLLRLGNGAFRIFLVFFEADDHTLGPCQLRPQAFNRLIQFCDWSARIICLLA